MNHIYFKRKISPPPESLSAKPLVVALMLIVVLVGIFLWKSERSKQSAEDQQTR